MKKITLIALLGLFFNLVSFAGAKIILEDNSSNYQQTENGYILNFQVISTNEELAEIKSKVADMSDRLAMEVTTSVANTHTCILKINHQNQPEYVHKMLLSIGFTQLEYKNETHSLDKIIEILYSYL